MRWLGSVVCLLSACGGRGELCEAESLQRALDRADRGSTVRMGRCRIDGSIAVPEEVTLLGAANDADEDNGIFSDEGAAVTLAPGAAVRNVHIASSGHTALLVTGERGEGARQVANLRVQVRRGAGLAVRGGTVRVVSTSFTGAVDDPSDPRFIRVAGFRVESACPDDLVCACTPGEVDGDLVCDDEGQWATWTSVYGIYARDAMVTLENVDLADFAEIGAAFITSELEWTGGTIQGVLGVGSLVRGGTADVHGVTVQTSAEGLRGLASYAWIATDEARFTSESLVLADNERYGFLNAGATGAHVDLVARDNGDVGVWVQSDDFSLSGSGTVLERNAFAGIVVTESTNVVIADATIQGTTSVRRTLGDLFGAQEIGDGVHMTASDAITMRGLTIRANERGGLLVDLGGGTPSFEDVQVDVVGEGFGALAGDLMGGDITVGTPALRWDDGITRSAAAMTADEDFMGVVDAVGVDAPQGFRDRIGIVYPMF